jgi:hypothetical protein
MIGFKKYEIYSAARGFQSLPSSFCTYIFLYQFEDSLSPQTHSEWHWFKQSPKTASDLSDSISAELPPSRWYLNRCRKGTA